MGGEDGALGLVAATRRERALAGLIDMAFAGVMVRLLWDRRGEAGASRSGGPLRRFAILAPLRAIVEEQIGSPGAWVAGIRTVDRRTGRRVALWRTAVLVGVRAGSQLAASRLQGEPPQPLSELERRELEEIHERHAGDRDARNRALAAHFEAHNRRVNVIRPVAIVLGSALLNSRLRRRLAPTSLVKRRT